jgi:hypothetical protein
MLRSSFLIASVTALIAGCGDGGVAKGSDMAACIYGDVSRSACTQPNAVEQGNCFESPRCVCVFPEATWVCCYAGYGGHDPPGLHVGDPCCGENVVVGQPGSPCYCDGTHHWTCPVDLGTTD